MTSLTHTKTRIQTNIQTHAPKPNALRQLCLYPSPPLPLESAVEIKLRRDGLLMLFEPFSLLANLITSGRCDAARSAPVQGHSLLGPLRGEEANSKHRATQMRSDPRSTGAFDYSAMHLQVRVIRSMSFTMLQVCCS